MENQNSPFQAGASTGLILGIISVVFTFLLYFIDPELMVKWYVGLGIFAVFITLIIYFGIQYRNSIGGYMNFGTAFNYVFAAFAVSGFIGVIGQALLFFVVDPALPKVLADAQMEAQMAMLDRLGAGDAMSSDQIDEMQASMTANYTFLGLLKVYGFSLIGYAIVSLILGAILKKRDKSLDY